MQRPPKHHSFNSELNGWKEANGQAPVTYGKVPAEHHCLAICHCLHSWLLVSLRSVEFPSDIMLCEAAVRQSDSMWGRREEPIVGVGWCKRDRALWMNDKIIILIFKHSRYTTLQLDPSLQCYLKTFFSITPTHLQDKGSRSFAPS